MRSTENDRLIRFVRLVPAEHERTVVGDPDRPPLAGALALDARTRARSVPVSCLAFITQEEASEQPPLLLGEVAATGVCGDRCDHASQEHGRAHRGGGVGVPASHDGPPMFGGTSLGCLRTNVVAREYTPQSDLGTSARQPVTKPGPAATLVRSVHGGRKARQHAEYRARRCGARGRGSDRVLPDPGCGRVAGYRVRAGAGDCSCTARSCETVTRSRARRSPS